MEALIIFMLGMSIGVVCSIFMTRKRLSDKLSGTIKIETFDPDGPFMFLELKEDLPTIINKKIVSLDVELLNDIPHE